jgi:hypothetical protein
VGTSKSADISKAVLLIGFILCTIGVIVVSALLVLRRRNT